MKSYGWISSRNVRRNFNRASGTKTAGYIMYWAKKDGAEVPDTEIQSRNLLSKENELYYILSISKNETGWRPNKKIMEKNPNLILTVDCNKNSNKDSNKGDCDWWFVRSGSYDVSKLATTTPSEELYTLSVKQLADSYFAKDINSGTSSSSVIWKLIMELMEKRK